LPLVAKIAGDTSGNIGGSPARAKKSHATRLIRLIAFHSLSRLFVNRLKLERVAGPNQVIHTKSKSPPGTTVLESVIAGRSVSITGGALPLLGWSWP
jgi:hypothetical protein